VANKLQRLAVSFLVIGVFVFAVCGALYVLNRRSALPESLIESNGNINSDVALSVNSTQNVVPMESTNQQDAGNIFEPQLPIDRPDDRITKKPFGIYITPKTSPIQPERFSGFHTGADFEIFADETEADVAIRALCSGFVKAARWVSGYGGVVVQECTLAGQQVTVLYGHLNIASVQRKIGGSFQEGELMGSLGKGYSSETDGERKHLHLSIHKGTAIAYQGYVSSKDQLDDWLDPAAFIRP